MRIAIPMADGKLSTHFGHCDCVALFDVDAESQRVLKREDLSAPPHEPGLLPSWLANQGATVIIAGGMGQRAQNLFTRQGIRTVIGAPVDSPDRLIADFLAGSLSPGENFCDH